MSNKSHEKIIRNEEIRTLREKGLALTAIAAWVKKKYGDDISRQRVHQLASGYILPNKSKWVEVLNKSIKKRDGFCCQWAELCDGTLKKPKDLIVHHIDFDNRNNNPANLITLCIRCHGSFHSSNHISPEIQKNLTFKAGGEKGERITIECRQCGKKFKVAPSQKERKYCSIECYWTEHRVRIKCDACGKIFQRPKSWTTEGGNYCNAECRSRGVGEKISATKRKKHHSSRKRAIELYKKGASRKSIAKDIGYCYVTICRWIKRGIA